MPFRQSSDVTFDKIGPGAEDGRLAVGRERAASGKGRKCGDRRLNGNRSRRTPTQPAGMGPRSRPGVMESVGELRCPRRQLCHERLVPIPSRIRRECAEPLEVVPGPGRVGHPGLLRLQSCICSAICVGRSPFHQGRTLGVRPDDPRLAPLRDGPPRWRDQYPLMDWSVRKVGIKELWTLKWTKEFDRAGPWTKAGGVQPENWPQWMRRFRDY